ncbi:major facilitator superfamily transporter [Colletotrichum scovillei]|uniref:Major facilitator superfamily transporter n=1 Tax=Colletotrichum scovillei TaxID=1209932 RepID=A0A9P7RJK1_9PEZI|nr:major facilitator superfamily transporter [Colletotrichum scovillei]KAF4780172.1 major facilitator superfamily transporter [Colletotrichum scovillei]KAG7058348.1 major facilitator superfamily transporter [Colletotrichum scovillei]KAG7076978.1 major facilitator superfamily transporter [Colletotrichum scovillei]KAG7084063.1 major facilitator superfamily transporter [Colletotrichum scovillei]
MNIALKDAMPEALLIQGAPKNPSSTMEMLPLKSPASTSKQSTLSHKLSSLPNDEVPTATEAEPPQGSPSRNVSIAKSITVIVTLAGINFLNTMGSGILIAALPRIAQDVGLDESLILWPAAVYNLAAGCLLLIFGAVADVVGAKLMWLTGSYLCVVFTVAVGLSQTGIQIILFRTAVGVSISACLPTAMAFITKTFPKGGWRNVAFSMNGIGFPLGYALGLVLGGIFTDTIGWRWAYYMMAIINFALSTAAVWSLPSIHQPSEKKWTRRLAEDIDWIGAVIMSVALGLLLYVLAMTTSSYTKIADPTNIALLAVAVALLVVFPVWMNFQTKRGSPALIPNRLWRNAAFTSICVSIFLCWASLNAIQYFIMLYFQKVQGISALQSSLRFLPHVVMGTLVNIAAAWLVSRIKVQTLGAVSAVITAAAPILMATVSLDGNYWFAPFWAMVLSPVNADALFTVSNLIISDAFPADVQSLAGGVFSEIGQIGNAVGLAVTAAIAASVTEHSAVVHDDAREARMEGYRAAFWTIFAATVAVLIIVVGGLRKGGTVGKKDD